MENYVENDDNNQGFNNSGQAFESDLESITDIEEDKDEKDDE